MIELITHPVNQRRLNLLTTNLPQSLLLTGEKGIGLFVTARSIAGSQVTHELYPKDTKGARDSISGTISVETVRELYENTRSKHTSRQVVIIDDADRMSLGAQGAFLKLLEEPHSGLHFILTSHHPERLLTTIRSRLQAVVLRPASKEQTLAQITSLGTSDPATQTKLLFIAEGLPAEIFRLHKDETYFKKRTQIMTDARSLIQGEVYDRLLTLYQYSSDRGAAIQLIEGMLLIIRRSLSLKPNPPLIEQLERLLDIREKLEANHNPKLQLMRYML